MKIISPSILSANYLNLKEDIEAFKEAQDIWFHLDIMDGHFVPNITFGPVILKPIQKITNHILDAHLMVTNPKDYLNWLNDCNITNFTYHFEAMNSVDEHIEFIHAIKKQYKSAGISIKPKTAPSKIDLKILNEIDLILIMTVEPGFGGQSFMHDCAEKIKYFKKLRDENKNYTYQIQVDGGINNETAKICFDYGADNLVAGSFIFKNNQSDYLKIINTLRN